MPQSFYIVQMLWPPALRPRRLIAPVAPRIPPPAGFSFHSVRAGWNSAEWSSSFPPLTSAHTLLLGGKIIPGRKNLSGGVKNYPVAE